MAKKQEVPKWAKELGFVLQTECKNNYLAKVLTNGIKLVVENDDDSGVLPSFGAIVNIYLDDNKTKSDQTCAKPERLRVVIDRFSSPTMIDDNPALTAAIAEMLWDCLPKDYDHPDLRQTGVGTKTKLGLRRTLESIILNHRKK